MKSLKCIKCGRDADMVSALYDGVIKERDDKISELNQQVFEKNLTIKKKNDALIEKNNRLIEVTERLVEKCEELDKAYKELDGKDREIKRLNHIIDCYVKTLCWIANQKDLNYGMSVREYEEDAMRTLSNQDLEKQLLEGLLGLNGEAGECIDIYKKHKCQGHDFDEDELALELGDVAWYLVEATNAIGYDFEDILRMNIEKRQKRYPDGFDSERSINRQEHAI